MKKFFSDLRLLWKALPIAKRYVLLLNPEKYIGVAKFQICYQKVSQALVAECGIARSEITGSVVYLALAFQAWRHSK